MQTTRRAGIAQGLVIIMIGILPMMAIVTLMPIVPALVGNFQHVPGIQTLAPLVLADTQRLVHANREADALRRLFPRARVENGNGASSETLRQLGLSADSIHLACHGVFRSDNPAFSAVELADGNFSALDAEKLGLANALVVLSACDSGVP